MHFRWFCKLMYISHQSLLFDLMIYFIHSFHLCECNCLLRMNFNPRNELTGKLVCMCYKQKQGIFNENIVDCILVYLLLLAAVTCYMFFQCQCLSLQLHQVDINIFQLHVYSYGSVFLFKNNESNWFMAPKRNLFLVKIEKLLRTCFYLMLFTLRVL